MHKNNSLLFVYDDPMHKNNSLLFVYDDHNLYRATKGLLLFIYDITTNIRLETTSYYFFFIFFFMIGQSP